MFDKFSLHFLNVLTIANANFNSHNAVGKEQAQFFSFNNFS